MVIPRFSVEFGEVHDVDIAMVTSPPSDDLFALMVELAHGGAWWCHDGEPTSLRPSWQAEGEAFARESAEQHGLTMQLIAPTLVQ
jgi:hypothetical protein